MHNISQTRKFWKSVYNFSKKSYDYFEKLSLIAYEGSGLTLLGFLEYNPQKNTLRMTKLSGFVAGGLKESLSFL